MPPTVQADPTASPVIINEIHYNPDLKTEQVEFIELYNPTAEPIDLFQWMIGGGIDFFFPRGAQLPANGFVVIAQNPAALRAQFGVNALGPYARRLGSEGDEIILTDNLATVVDQVQYGFGFPWPIVGDAPGHSIQLSHLALDNELPSSWRAGPPTPGWANATLVDNTPPALASISHSPQAPTEADRVTITVKVSDSDGVRDVTLFYQWVEPGQYIAIYDPQYATNWVPLPMTRLNDETFAVEMPAHLQRHRHLVRYRVQAVDNTGRSVTAPYPDDPQPNFAYFVYNGLPPWRAAIKPGGFDELGHVSTYNFNAMRPLAVYHFLAKANEVADSQFIPDSQRNAGYMGDDYPWRGTLVYNGQVYDHIGFRARGGVHRYSVGKNMWKFNFPRGHRFQAYDDYGRPYPVKWDKLNFSATIQHANRRHRGEHGLFEAVAFRLFALAGVEASDTHYVHFRVIDDAREYAGQYRGDFWGLYLAIQELDGRWLDQHQLPDGNLYKMENWTGELNNVGVFGPTDKGDLNLFIGAYTHDNPDANWWRQNFDLERYYGFRAVTEFVHHYDQDQGKNYHYYLNPETGRWSIHPWDLDLTWSEVMFGEGNEPFRDRVLPHPELNIAYQNRLRELRDLLFTPEQMFALLDEYTAFINSSSNGLPILSADRAMWDYNPILLSRYVENDRGGHGRFYERPRPHTFAGMLQIMRDWIVTRGAWIDRQLLTDTLLPFTPAATYAGPANYPADQLRVQSSGFGDANGAFAAMQWRAAEIVWPGLPGYQPNTPNRYEIEGGWQSTELTTFTPEITVPAGVCRVGYLCRVRVRMKNNLGRWSHWSAPAEFVVGPPAGTLAGQLQISELMYHPPLSGYLPDSDFEFIELKNVSAASIDLSNLRFTTGINYTFPMGTQLAPGAYLVLAKSTKWFQTRYGFVPFGEYNDKLSDKGEELTLVDAFDRPVISFSYQDSDPWPKAADGQGFSLVLQNPELGVDLNQASNWQSSTFSLGSPGSAEPVAIWINEVLANPATGQNAAVELYNPGPRAAPIGGWYLAAATPQRFQFPADTVIPPGGYLVLTSATLGLEINASTPAISLFATYVGGKIGGYAHSFTLNPTPAGVSLGRYVDSTGRAQFVPQLALSLGEPNFGPRVGPVVISGLRYRTTDGVELVELTNITDAPIKLYDPLQPVNSWRLQGLFYPLPSGVELPAYGKVLIASQAPHEVCARHTISPGVRVLGPLPVPLADTEQALALWQPEPGAEPGLAPYTLVDEVQYRSTVPWPPLGNDLWLVRKALNGYGNDPVNWQISTTPLSATVTSATAPPAAIVCSFTVLPRPEGGFAATWATNSEENVAGFNLWRSADGVRDHAELVTPTVVVAQTAGPSGAGYNVVDSTAQPGIAYLYWLQVVSPAGESTDLLFTTPQPSITQTHLPIVGR